MELKKLTEVQKLSGSSKEERQYTDAEIERMRKGFKNHLLTTRLPSEFETFPEEWRVYSWDHGEKCEAMHPHDALLLELEGKIITDMTEKHGFRPAHMKWVERKRQREHWEKA